MPTAQRKNFLANKTLLLRLISILAFALILIQGVHFAHSMDVTMDEGTYLLKGKYYLEGKYSVYEQGGPVTNKGPFSFWIFGIPQVIAPGLRSGRYFSLFLLSLMLLALWKLVQRFASEAWAAGILWLFALSGYWISLYSRAMSEIITAALITFSLFFLLGRARKTWELSIALLLAAVTALTRQNLLPYFGFAMLYVFWEHGFKRKALLSAGISGGFFLLLNLVYWPEMYLSLWAPYLPSFLTALIEPLTNPLPAADLGQSALDRRYGIVAELQVLFQAFRIYFIPLLYVLFFTLIYSWKKDGKRQDDKPVIFLFTSFAFLFILHFAAAVLENNFLYSFPAYPGFFLPIGLLLVAASFSRLKRKLNAMETAAILSIFVLVCTGIGLNLHRRVSDPLMVMSVPRMRSMRILPGTTELWRLLENKFHFGYDNLEFILSAGFGFFAGIILVGAGVVAWLILRKRISISLGRWVLFIMFGAGLILTPTTYLAGQPSVTVCQQNVLKRQEEVGRALAAIIPPGSLIYWEYYSPTLLLYVEDIELFPVQLNDEFYKREGGDPESLLASNLWNDEIAEEWLLEADYILLDEEAAKRWEPVINDRYFGQFDKLKVTENAVPCIDRTYVHIYRKLP